MALITAAFSPDPTLFNLHAVEAGDAAEMVSRLNNARDAAVAAGETEFGEFKLAGAGSGPQWEAWFLTGQDVQPVSVGLNEVRFVAVVAGNIPELLLRLKQAIVAALASDVFKVEIAGAGDGPTYMAVAVIVQGEQSLVAIDTTRDVVTHAQPALDLFGLTRLVR